MSKNKNRYIALSYLDFRLLWIGQFISIIGTQMQVVGLNWHVYELTHSAVALGGLGLNRFIPILIFSMIGGSIADSRNRKTILLITQSILVVLSLILSLVTITHMINIFWIYLIGALSAIVFSFDAPARQSFVPSLVKKEHLPNAMSLNMISWQTATIIGPGLAGFMLAKFGVSSIYLFNAISYIAVIVALLLMKTKHVPAEVKVKVSLQSAKEAITFVKSKKILWSTMVLDFFSTFFASATSLLPIYAKDILRVGPQGLGILYAAPAVGAVIAGFVVAHMGSIKRAGFILLLAVAVYGFSTIIFGVSNIFIISLLALILIGGGDSLSTIIRSTIRQLETPDHIRGRMTAVNMIFVMGGPQLGEFESGLLAAWLGAPLSVVVGGVGTLIVVGIIGWKITSLRKYEHTFTEPLT